MKVWLDVVVKPTNWESAGIVQAGIVVLVQGSTTSRLTSPEAEVVGQVYPAGKIARGTEGQMGFVVTVRMQLPDSDLSAVQIASLTVLKVKTVAVIKGFGFPEITTLEL